MRQREPTHADLVAATQGHTTPDRALLTRAKAGREAIDRGADPELTLALVVWPSDELAAALEHAGSVKGSGRSATAASHVRAAPRAPGTAYATRRGRAFLRTPR